MNKNCIENVRTSHNKRYMLRHLTAARATKKRRQATPCAFFLRHIFRSLERFAFLYRNRKNVIYLNTINDIGAAVPG